MNAHAKDIPAGTDEVNAGHLRAFIERIERLEGEIDALNTDKKDVYSEAKSTGFDTKTIKKIVALRRKDPSERAEEETIMELYLRALGMES